MNRRIYIAGPMTGLPNWNRHAFNAAAIDLRTQGHDVVNPAGIAPHAHNGDCPPSYAVADDGHSAACYLRNCFAALLTCDEIHLLPGWRHSVGAIRERHVADWVGMPIRQGAAL